jgi:hypothetical protein
MTLQLGAGTQWAMWRGIFFKTDSGGKRGKQCTFLPNPKDFTRRVNCIGKSLAAQANEALQHVGHFVAVLLVQALATACMLVERRVTVLQVQ